MNIRNNSIHVYGRPKPDHLKHVTMPGWNQMYYSKIWGSKQMIKRGAIEICRMWIYPKGCLNNRWRWWGTCSSWSLSRTRARKIIQIPETSSVLCQRSMPVFLRFMHSWLSLRIVARLTDGRREINCWCSNTRWQVMQQQSCGSLGRIDTRVI